MKYPVDIELIESLKDVNDAIFRKCIESLIYHAFCDDCEQETTATKTEGNT